MIKLLGNLDTVAALLGVAYIFIRRFNRNGFGGIMYYVYFQVVIISTIFLMSILFKHLNNIYLYQINAFTSLVLLEMYFFKQVNIFSRKKLRIIIIILNIILGIYMLFFEGREALNSYSYGIVSLAVTVYCLTYYFNLLNNPMRMPILESPDFWFVTGLLLYYSLCMFIFLPYKTFTRLHIVSFSNHGLDIWVTQNIIFSIMILFFIKGFSCNKLYKTL